MKKHKTKVRLEIETSFYAEDEAERKNIERQIVRWVKGSTDELRFIPFYLKDEDGQTFECCTSDSKIKVRK